MPIFVVFLHKLIQRTCIFLLGITILIGFQCKQKVEIQKQIGYAYFGYKVGQVRYYRCDSIIYNSFNPTNPQKKIPFIIKESVVSTFLDNEGSTVFRLERYISKNNDSSYDFFNIATIQMNESGIQYKENNKRYLRLAFPVKEKRNWNGNLYNNLDFQKYIYKHVEKPFSNGFLNFPKTLWVNQQDDITIIEENIEDLYYAEEKGMVQWNFKKIDIDGSRKDGIEFNWKLESIL